MLHKLDEVELRYKELTSMISDPVISSDPKTTCSAAILVVVIFMPYAVVTVIQATANLTISGTRFSSAGVFTSLTVCDWPLKMLSMTDWPI